MIPISGHSFLLASSSFLVWPAAQVASSGRARGSSSSRSGTSWRSQGRREDRSWVSGAASSSSLTLSRESLAWNSARCLVQSSRALARAPWR